MLHLSNKEVKCLYGDEKQLLNLNVRVHSERDRGVFDPLLMFTKLQSLLRFITTEGYSCECMNEEQTISLFLRSLKASGARSF